MQSGGRAGGRPLKDREAAALTAWAFGVLAALLVAIFGTLALAVCKGGKTPPTCAETRSCERCESGAEAERCGRAAGCEAKDEEDPPPLAIDLTVNLVAAPSAGTDRPGAATARWVMTQTVTANGKQVALTSSDGKNDDESGEDGNGDKKPSDSDDAENSDKEPSDSDDGANGERTPVGSELREGRLPLGAMTQRVVVNVPPPATTAGGGGRDMVVFFDREKTVEKAPETGRWREKDRCGGEKPGPSCAGGDEPEGGAKPGKRQESWDTSSSTTEAGGSFRRTLT